MKRFLCIILSLFVGLGIFAQNTESKLFSEIFEEASNTEGLVILNVWATWCKPCVAELPHFQKAQDSLINQHIKIIIASVDFETQRENIASFLAKRNIRLTSYHIKDGTSNDWFTKLDEEFSGAIPASIFFYNGKKVGFHEGDFTFEELMKSIKKYSN